MDHAPLPSLRDDAGHEDPEAEVRACLASAGFCEATGRGLVHVAGPDAEGFLHRILSNDVRGLGPGDCNRTLLLSPKGEVRFCAELCRDAEGFRLTTVPGDAAPLCEALEAYHFGETLAIEDMSRESAPLELWGPRAGDALAAALGPLDLPAAGGWSEVAWEGLALRIVAEPATRPRAWTLRVDAGPAGAERLWRALAAHARPVGPAAREVLRVEAGLARAGAELDGTPRPQEVGLAHAVSPGKGCYVGQEVVAKIDTYGGPNRRLVGLCLPDAEPRAPGAVIRTGSGEEAGRVTSWVRSVTLGRGLALGLVKTRLFEGASLTVDGTAAERVDLPLETTAG